MNGNGPAEEETLFDLDAVCLAGQKNLRLSSVSLKIRAGVTAVVGMSGAGKTSLLNLLAGFEQPDSGRIRRVDERKSRQNGDSDLRASGRMPLFWVPSGGGLWPHMTAGEHLVSVQPGSEMAVRAEIADKILNAFDLTHRAGAYPAELSQGERSRLSLARAIATEAEILILDEPLSHVDTIRQPKYWQNLRRAAAEHGISMIFSSHEPETILRESSQVICLEAGKVVWHGPTCELYDHPASREAAAFLGPVNWIGDQQDVGLLPFSWIEGIDEPGVTGLRPERIHATLDETAFLKVVRSEHRGWLSETHVVDSVGGRTGCILHLATGEAFVAGQGVRFGAQPIRKRGF